MEDAVRTAAAAAATVTNHNDPPLQLATTEPNADVQRKSRTQTNAENVVDKDVGTVFKKISPRHSPVPGKGLFTCCLPPRTPRLQVTIIPHRDQNGTRAFKSKKTPSGHKECPDRRNRHVTGKEYSTLARDSRPSIFIQNIPQRSSGGETY